MANSSSSNSSQQDELNNLPDAIHLSREEFDVRSAFEKI
jgi:hypothetical protein